MDTGVWTNYRRLRDWALFHLRAWAWDISSDVTWLPTSNSYFEDDETAAAYDSVEGPKARDREISSWRKSYPLITLLIDKRCRSVLDIGCGAGVFYHLLRETLPDIHYHGIDLSEAQIKRARANFGDRFSVADAAELSVADLNRFDGVHVNSVFAFVAINKQLALLENILASDAWTAFTVGATFADVRYAPRRCFANHGGDRANKRFTALAWPFRSQIETILGRYARRYDAVWKETEVATKSNLNRLNRDGTAVPSPGYRRRMRRRLGNLVLPSVPRSKIFEVTVKPRDWPLPGEVADYPGASPTGTRQV